MPEVVVRCRYCKEEFFSWGEAEDHEIRFGTPVHHFKVGDVFTYSKNNDVKTFEILERQTISDHSKHIPVYLLKWNGRNRIMHDDSLQEFIKKNNARKIRGIKRMFFLRSKKRG